MIIKKIKVLFYLILSAHSAIFGMRNVGSRLGAPSNIASASLAPAPVAKTIQTPTIPLEASQQATQEFLASQKKSEQKQSGGQWTEQKFWKGAAAALGIVTAQQAVQWLAEQEITKEEEEKLKELDKKAEARRTWDSLFFDKVSKVYPEVYGVFLKIKKDMGINEHVNFYLINDIDQLQTDVLAYCTSYGDIFIFESHIQNVLHSGKKYSLIQTLAHELEHYKQFRGYRGSYDCSLIPELLGRVDSTLMETGAEANAADYLYCSTCLKEYFLHCLPSRFSDKYQQRQQEGYFVSDDHEVYRQRAYDEGALCPAHQILFPGLFPDRLKPLRSFLPPKPK